MTRTSRAEEITLPEAGRILTFSVPFLPFVRRKKLPERECSVRYEFILSRSLQFASTKESLEKYKEAWYQQLQSPRTSQQHSDVVLDKALELEVEKAEAHAQEEQVPESVQGKKGRD